MKKIAIVGLGYVGLPLAVEFGKTRDVIGFDINTNRVEELNNGVDHTNECSKEQIGAAIKLTFSNKIDDIADARIFIVTVATPVDRAKQPDLNFLLEASRMIGSVLKHGDIVIYESTVFPGATEEICVPELELVSGLQLNRDFYCGYSPERINPGDKINTLSKIKKVTSGSNQSTADEIDELYKSIIDAGTYKASSIRVAEAAKVIENTQRDINIAFVNELSSILNIMGIDTLEVLEAAGSKWNFLPFRPGLVGGHCIGVDPYYLIRKAEEVGESPKLMSSARQINDGMATYTANQVIKMMNKNNVKIKQAKVGVYGVTFKENCPDCRNSKVFDLIAELESWDVEVIVVDPWVNEDEIEQNQAVCFGTISETSKVDAIVIAVGHKQFREMKLSDLKKSCNGDNPVLADLKGVFSRELAASEGFDVFRL